MIRETEEQIRGLQEKVEELGAQCDAAGYEIDEPLDVEETEVKAAACKPMSSKPTAKPRKLITLCRQQNRAECSQCNYTFTPAHQCQALIAICQECGQ